MEEVGLVSDRVLDYTQRFCLGVPIFYVFFMGWVKGRVEVVVWSERVTFEGKRLVVGIEINRTEFSLAS